MTVGAVRTTAGVQIRFTTKLTGEEYVSRQAWREATLSGCPRHPRGGCGFARHGTYGRKHPAGCRIARYYCPTAHETYSLLPDCLASRLGSTLAEVEAVVIAVEQAKSVERAADGLRPEIELPGALRWTRRRVLGVRAALTAIISLLPVLFALCSPTVRALRATLDTTPALPALRAVAADALPHLPPPLGFGPRPRPRRSRRRKAQHQTGPDPPARLS